MIVSPSFCLCKSCRLRLGPSCSHFSLSMFSFNRIEYLFAHIAFQCHRKISFAFLAGGYFDFYFLNLLLVVFRISFSCDLLRGLYRLDDSSISFDRRVLGDSCRGGNPQVSFLPHNDY